MSLTLGEKLRQAREEQGISISEVAENTRISPHYIRSIENDDYKPLPGGIFNKGFIKSYARFIGVDENEALHDYASLVNAQTEDPIESHRPYRPEVLTDERNFESRAPTIIFAAVILALMTVGILFLVRFLQNRSAEPAMNATVAANTAVSNANGNSVPDQSPAVSATDKISILLRAEGGPVWISYTTDGNSKVQTLETDESMTIEPTNSFSISYSKAKIDNLKVSLNGKEVATPKDSPRGTVEFAINRSNVGEILRSGQISSSVQGGSAPPAPKPSVKTTPKPAASPKPSPRSSANVNKG
jgi:cytoskeletal protein RodZ